MDRRLDLEGPLGRYALCTWIETEAMPGERVELLDLDHAEALLRQLLVYDPSARARLRALVDELDGPLLSMTHVAFGDEDRLLRHAARALAHGRLRLHHSIELMASDPVTEGVYEPEYVAPVNEINDDAWAIDDEHEPWVPFVLEVDHEPKPRLELDHDLGPDPHFMLDGEHVEGPLLVMESESEFNQGLAMETEHELVGTLELEAGHEPCDTLSFEAEHRAKAG